jgi:hypothetical protein
MRFFLFQSIHLCGSYASTRNSSNRATAKNKLCREFEKAGKRREAPGNFTSASPYSFNVNRTSQDHLLLGENADVDKSVEWSEYTAGPRRCQDKRSLALGFEEAKHSY